MPLTSPYGRQPAEQEPLLPQLHPPSSAHSLVHRTVSLYAIPLGLLALFIFAIACEPLFISPSRLRTSPSPTYAPGDINIDVLTYNAFLRPAGVGLGDYQNQRLPHIVHAVSGYGIAMLQEVFWLSFKKTAFLRQLSATVPFYVTSPMPGLPGLLQFPPKLVDGGLTITSKYPIEDTDFIPYADAIWRSIDIIVAKGVLYGKVRLPSREGRVKNGTCLHVFTTHAQANNGLDGAAFAEVRARQQEQLADFIVEKTGGHREECSILLGGDFNSDGRRGPGDGRSSGEYEVLEEALAHVTPRLFDVLYEEMGQTHPVTNAGGLSGRDQKKERLDYIFFGQAPREGAAVVPSMTRPPAVVEFWIDELRPEVRSCSDHFGVQFSLNTRGKDG